MNRRYALCIMAWLMAASSGFAATLDSKTIAAIDAIAAKVLPGGQTPGIAIGIMQDGVVVFDKGFGIANLEHRIPVTPDTVFQVASITKQFTAASILLLAQDGVLSTNDKLSKFFPEFPRADQVTIKQLLTHSSGLPSLDEKPQFPTFARQRHTFSEILDWIKPDPYLSDPGTKFYYSNSGYVLLRGIIERVTGMNFAAFLQQRIFGRLGLMNTRLRIDAADIVPNFATGYVPRDGAAGQFMNRPFIEPSNTGGGGGIVSTVGDLMTWHKALFGNSVMSPSSFSEMTTPATFSSGEPIAPSYLERYHPQRRYGYGFALIDFNGHTKMGHTGVTAGFSSIIFTYPQDRLTIVILTNGNGGNALTVPIERDIAAVLLKN